MVEKIKKIAKTANKSVTNTESWWSFGHLIYGLWAMIGGAVTTGVVKIWQSALNVGWEYWIVAGTPTMLITVFALSWAWHLRPSAKQARIDKKESQNSPYVTADAAHKETADDTEARLRILEQKSDPEDIGAIISPLMQAMDAAMQERFQNLKVEQERAIDALFANKKSNDALKFGHLAEILDAKSALVRFDEKTKGIDDAIVSLDPIPLDENWSELYSFFKRTLEEWDKFQNDYPIPVYIPLFDVKQDDLKAGLWSDNVKNLPSDEGLDYKYYRLARKAYLGNRDRIRKRIESVANATFHGRSASTHYVDRFKH